jgi:hypothetical protein
MWETIEQLGLDDTIRRADILAIAFKNVFCDNTEARTEDVMRSFHAVGTNLQFIPKLRADLNAPSEAGHHKIHRLGSHQLRGSTRGSRFKERSEESAVDLSCHNVLEALRDFMKAVHLHNTMEIDVHVPLRLRDKIIKPSRLSLTRALMEETMSRRSVPAGLARLHLLPRYRGTFCADGVRLHNPRSLEKVEFIGPLVYLSTHPYVIRLFEEARRRTRRDPDFFRRDFLVHPFKVSRIWFIATDCPTGFELIELQLAVERFGDPDLVQRATLDDVIDLALEDRKAKPARHRSRDQELATHEAEQREGERRALEEQRKELDAVGPVSKKQLRSNRSENRAAENEMLIEGVPVLIAGLGNGAGEGARLSEESIRSVPQQSEDQTDEASSRRAGSLLRRAARSAADGGDDDSV